MPVLSSIGHVRMLVAAAACWGFGTVLTKQVLADVPPLPLLAVQLAASVLFLFVASRLGRVSRIRWSPQLRRLAALGILNPGLAYALGLIGLTSISASMSVLLWATEPILILLLAVLLLRESVPAPLAAATARAVGGVLLVVYRPEAAGSSEGIALTLLAVLACALYTVLARLLLLDDAGVTVVLRQQITALAFAIAICVVAETTTTAGLSRLPSLPMSVWITAAASGVLYYGLAFWLYLNGLRGVPASAAGAFITLVPVFGVAGGYIVGDRLSVPQWAGAVVVVGAITAIAMRRVQTT